MAADWDLEPGNLDQLVPDNYWIEYWALNQCGMAQAFFYLHSLDLGPEFGVAGDEAAGEIRFQDCPGMCSTYRAAETSDLLSISLLQNRLNELGENTLVELSGMHRSRWAPQ